MTRGSGGSSASTVPSVTEQTMLIVRTCDSFESLRCSAGPQ